MKIKFDIDDLVIFASQDGNKYGGTIIGNDDIGYILKVGQDNSDIEVIEKKSIKGAYIGFGVNLLNIAPYEDYWNIEREPYIPPLPQSIPPRYVGNAMKWFHSPNGLCTCGCKTGGESSSPDGLLGK